PAVSAILNITPNHLDRHPTMKHYVSAKRAVINYQRPDEPLVMNLDNDMTRTIGAQFGAKTRWFSLEAQVPGGACLIDNQLAFFDSEDDVTHIVPVAEVKLRGRHNLANSLAACLLAREVGVSTTAMRQVLTTFAGVEHRLQFVRELKGVAYFNDSISTSPERLSAGLLAFKEPVILLAGGYDKKLPWDDAARTIIHKTRQVFLFGPGAPLIDAAINRVRRDIKSTDTEVHHCETMAEALTGASQIARPGEVVLLSPGCASFDAFRNYMERGQYFIDLVGQL
ncbi:MAG: UDP-N-acetylmuramoyl-L-alanine--D-glutamate ligase, partial [Anaerolineae bacterium]|nr:UDP-N-acetylmuramoyl-L-alanine--D-glutamate ligase [Anaerolineae bacterium]